MKERMSKFIVIAIFSIMAIGGLITITTSKAKANVDASFACPNGCLTTKGECYCNGFHHHEEYIHPQ